jgi:tRNA-dihydrouridine synthase B
MRIGAHILRNNLFVAPMAGVTDRPFRRLARRYGAGLAVSEMVSSRPELRDSRKTRLRLDHAGESGPIAVQIAGAEPAMLAEAARYNVALGADIIDINMGCPAKKVCNAYAGSALLADEPLVGRILEAVVAAAGVPVTLKIRTGPVPERRNALRIARIAESAGVQLLAIHGRTRACGFAGRAEYQTIAEVKSQVRIPVLANGDIETPEDAARVLAATGADGLMIGRAAHGRPWLFREIEHFLASGERLAPPCREEMRAVLIEHLEGLYALYGSEQGTRVARKHIGWTVRGLPDGDAFRSAVNRIDAADAQHSAVNDYFDRLAA